MPGRSARGGRGGRRGRGGGVTLRHDDDDSTTTESSEHSEGESASSNEYNDPLASPDVGAHDLTECPFCGKQFKTDRTIRSRDRLPPRYLLASHILAEHPEGQAALDDAPGQDDDPDAIDPYMDRDDEQGPVIPCEASGSQTVSQLADARPSRRESEDKPAPPLLSKKTEEADSTEGQAKQLNVTVVKVGSGSPCVVKVATSTTISELLAKAGLDGSGRVIHCGTELKDLSATMGSAGIATDCTFHFVPRVKRPADDEELPQAKKPRDTPAQEEAVIPEAREAATQETVVGTLQATQEDIEPTLKATQEDIEPTLKATQEDIEPTLKATQEEVQPTLEVRQPSDVSEEPTLMATLSQLAATRETPSSPPSPAPSAPSAPASSVAQPSSSSPPPENAGDSQSTMERVTRTRLEVVKRLSEAIRPFCSGAEEATKLGTKLERCVWQSQGSALAKPYRVRIKLFFKSLPGSRVAMQYARGEIDEQALSSMTESDFAARTAASSSTSST